MKQKLLDDGTLYVEVKHALQVKRVLIEDREHWGTMLYPEDPIDLVRCAECRYVGTDATCCLVCDREGMGLKPFHVYPDDFCSYGCRKESE